MSLSNGGGMKILLGCGDEHRNGWVHLDRIPHSPHVDVAHDLNVVPWPFEDGCAKRIEAIDVLEHLNDPVAFFDECWRILHPLGSLWVQTVHYQSENCWRDPTHRRGFHPDVFRYFDPGSPWHQTFGKFYTRRTWKVLGVWVIDPPGNVQAELEPRKPRGANR